MPNVRFKIQGIHLCEKLNKHLKWKMNTGTNFYLLYFFCIIIKYVCYKRIQQAIREKNWGRITAFI